MAARSGGVCIDSRGVHPVNGSGVQRIDISVVGRQPDGRCIVHFALWSLDVIEGGGEEIPWEEEPIRDFSVVPEAGGTTLCALWLLFHRIPFNGAERGAPFTAAEVVRWTRDGKTGPLIEELGPKTALDPERLDKHLESIVGVPAGGYVLHRAGAGRYRVEHHRA